MECKWNKWWVFASDIPELMAWVFAIFWVIVVAALLARTLCYISEGQ